MELIFGKYQVVERIAIGGMGEIFRAVEKSPVTGFERSVILKNLLPELAAEPDFVAQFFDEARVAQSLDHPNIVSIREVGEWHGAFYIAMELIKGCNVSQLLRAAKKAEVRIPCLVSAKIAGDAALGLDHAHHATNPEGQPLNIVHRDVSPQNIMVREDGTIKVVDFGIARASNKSSRTATGQVKGKLAYMAPEQVSLGDVTSRADQFALGVVLWELCTQRRLFTSESDVHLINEVRACNVPGPRTFAPDVPQALEDIVMRMLRREPHLRYPSAAHAARHLHEFIAISGQGPVEPMVSKLLKQLGVNDASLKPPRAVSLGSSSEQVEPSLPAPRSRRALFAGLGGALALLVLGLLVLGLAAVWPPSTTAPVAQVVRPTTHTPTRSEQNVTVLEPAPTVDVSPALVKVICPGSEATGFFIGQGRLVTRAHLACDTAKVRLGDGRTLLARMVKQQRDVDLAELDVGSGEDEGLPLGESISLKPKTPVHAATGARGTVTEPVSSWLGVPQVEVHFETPVEPGSPVLSKDRVVGVLTNEGFMLPIEALGPASPWPALKERARVAIAMEGQAMSAALAQPRLAGALIDRTGGRFAVLLSRATPSKVELSSGACRASLDTAWEPFRPNAWFGVEMSAVFNFIEEHKLDTSLSMSVVRVPPSACDATELRLDGGDLRLRSARFVKVPQTVLATVAVASPAPQTALVPVVEVPPAAAPPLDEVRWRARFRALHDERETLERTLIEKSRFLEDAERQTPQRVGPMAQRDQVLFLQYKKDLENADADRAVIQRKLDDLDREASAASVPREWRR